MKSYEECFHEILKAIGAGILGHSTACLMLRVFNIQTPPLFNAAHHYHFCLLIVGFVIIGTLVRYMIEYFNK